MLVISTFVFSYHVFTLSMKNHKLRATCKSLSAYALDLYFCLVESPLLIVCFTYYNPIESLKTTIPISGPLL